MQYKKYTPVILLALLLASCASILPGNDPVLVNSERTINASHQAVYGLYKLEHERYAFFKAKAPEQAKAVRRQVNVLRANYPKVEKTAWDAKETYRKDKSDANKNNVTVALDVLQQIVDDAQSYQSTINAKSK